MDKNKRTSYSDSYLFQQYKKTIYLEGYFESEKYFKECYRDDLIKEFSFKSNTKFGEIILLINIIDNNPM